MGLGEAILAVGAGERAASFELFSETLDAEWIAQALRATGTATIRRERVAEHPGDSRAPRRGARGPPHPRALRRALSAGIRSSSTHPVASRARALARNGKTAPQAAPILSRIARARRQARP